MGKRLALLTFLAMGGLALVVLPIAAAPATTTTYFVGPAGNNLNPCTSLGAPCLTIGGALGKAAASGDTIVVAAGTYHEHLTANKSVTINSAGAASTLVDGSATDRVLTVTANMSVVLSNLTIKNGHTAGNGRGILNNGTVVLDHSLVTTNTAAASTAPTSSA